MPKPYLVGLTGSIGMGKSETLKLFASLDIPVYDADATVHALYEPGGAAVEPIAAAFAGTVVAGRVDRKLLAQRVAGDEAAFQKLEAIVHPLAAQMRDIFITQVGRAGAELIVLDIPLLFETGANTQMDAVVVVSAPHHIQRERVLAREGMSIEKLEAIHARQVPDAEKRAQADFVIETDKGIEHALAQVKRVVAELRARAKTRK